MFVYTAIRHVVVRKCPIERQNGGLVVKNYESFHLWVFQDVWVFCAKPQVLHSLDVLTKIFTNSLAVLNQQALGRTDYVHCFQAELTESCVAVWFLVDKRPACCFLIYEKQSGYPD